MWKTLWKLWKSLSPGKADRLSRCLFLHPAARIFVRHRRPKPHLQGEKYGSPCACPGIPCISMFPAWRRELCEAFPPFPATQAAIGGGLFPVCCRCLAILGGYWTFLSPCAKMLSSPPWGEKEREFMNKSVSNAYAGFAQRLGLQMDDSGGLYGQRGGFSGYGIHADRDHAHPVG